MILELEAEDPRRRRIDEAQADALAATDGKAGRNTAIDGHRVTDPAAHAHFHRIVEILGNRPIAPQPPIAQYPHHVAVDRQRVWLLDNESAGKAAAHLLGAVRMRVIPIGAGIRHRELVGEAFARLDRRLGDVRSAVHGIRDAQPVPMHRSVLGQPVLHHDPDAIALANPDFRSRRLPAVAPNIGFGIRPADDREPGWCGH